MSDKKYRILIVDDHPMMRAGLASCIEAEPDMTVCGGAANMTEAMRLIANEAPDLVTIDLSLAGGSGLDLIERIKAHNADMLMLVISMHDESLYAERVLAAGSRGYVNKQADPTRMIEAIRTVLEGKIYLSETMTERMLHSFVNNEGGKKSLSPAVKLTNRELTIFELIGEGKPTSKIASHLNLSIKTIESHQANIKKKLGLNTAHELNRRAMLWIIEQN